MLLFYYAASDCVGRLVKKNKITGIKTDTLESVLKFSKQYADVQFYYKMALKKKKCKKYIEKFNQLT